MNRGLATGIVGAAVLVLAALAWRHAGGDAGPQSAAGGQGGAAAAQEAESAAAAAAPADGQPARSQPPATPPPLPSLDMPLRLAVDGLRHRADAGDAAAACRLAAEFERCRALATRAEQVRPMDVFLETMAANADDPGHVERVQREIGERDRAWRAAAIELEHCQGVQAPSPAERARYWRRAAMAGHVPAMRHYAIGNAFRLEDLMAAVPELETYRHEAEQVAVRAAAAGDLAMIHALAQAYLPRERGPEWAQENFRPFLAQVVEADARKALEWLYALQAHPDLRGLPASHPVREFPVEHVAGLEARLPADAIAAANGAASERARGWRPGQSGPLRMTLYGNGGLGDVSREECEPGPRDWSPGA